MFVLKNYLGVLLKIITHICDTSLSQSIFFFYLPTVFTGLVIRLLLQTTFLFLYFLPLVKMLEKIVEIKLKAHLSENYWLSNSQYGSRSGRGTENAIHSVVEFMHQSYDENKFAWVYFLMWKKLLSRWTQKSSWRNWNIMEY